jgi:Zn-dependent M28 family amino/carboxypeptidase
MDPKAADTFDAYSGAVDQRVSGASQAARYGAVGVLVRTLTTLPDDNYPHTGVVEYAGDAPQIPAAAISTHDANRLSGLVSNGGAHVRLELSAQWHDAEPSFNVIAELRGRDLPDQIVDVGGHLDSWDLAPAAHDDGAGATQSIEALRLIKAQGTRPRRTVRAVLFMCEEFGGIGADEYARVAQAQGERHVAAIESDRGGYAPVGFQVEGSADALAQARGWSRALTVAGAGKVDAGFSGTDVEPLQPLGAVGFGYVPDSTHYFDLHHSALDQLAAVDPNELEAGASAMATLAWLAAEHGITP